MQTHDFNRSQLVYRCYRD